MNNSAYLEAAVLTGSPEEAAELCKKLGENENSCRALALACRYVGMDYVKALVEAGATFKYTRPEVQGGYFTLFYWLAPLEMTKALRVGFFINRTDKVFDNSITLTDVRNMTVKAYQTLPMEKRVEIVRYLCENKERVLLDINELLYYSIISGSREITAVLKEYGAKFSEKRTTVLTEGGRSFEWQEYSYMVEYLDSEDCFDILREIAAEVGGKPLHFTDAIFWAFTNPNRKLRLTEPKFFKFLLDNFNQKKMNKTQLMKGAINENSVECLAMCAEQGWLKAPKKRDEMIEYASNENKPECTAFLLDFKNKNFDLKAERAKAEKKIEQELTAAPDSVSELKKIWSYKKREDGTLVITSYKGTRGEIIVPEKIGKSEVSEIGSYAFAASAPRIKIEQRDFRRKEITRIVLPDTIKVVGEYAFSSCEALEEVNIPEGVVEIKEEAFMGCKKLAALVIPDSVKTIGKSAFAGCQGLRSIKLSEGLSELGDYLLTNCRSLEKITLPAGIQSIGIWALARCVSLEELVIPDGVTEIKRQAFMNCDKLKTVVIPASVKTIKNYVYRKEPPATIFEESPNVTAVVEPKSCAERYCKKHGIAFKYREEK